MVCGWNVADSENLNVPFLLVLPLRQKVRGNRSGHLPEHASYIRHFSHFCQTFCHSVCLQSNRQGPTWFIASGLQSKRPQVKMSPTQNTTFTNTKNQNFINKHKHLKSRSHEERSHITELLTNAAAWISTLNKCEIHIVQGKSILSKVKSIVAKVNRIVWGKLYRSKVK